MTSASGDLHDSFVADMVGFVRPRATATDWFDLLKVPLLTAKRQNGPEMTQRLVHACNQLCSMVTSRHFSAHHRRTAGE